jgi:maltoporin
MSATVGLRNATINDRNVKDFWIGVRPQYHLNKVWSLMAEAGYQHVKPEGEATRKLAKLTLGTQFSMGQSVWSRPSIRFYATHAKWNDAAAAAGAVACTGRDCNTAADGYGAKRNGTGYGVQVEAWF